MTDKPTLAVEKGTEDGPRVVQMGDGNDVPDSDTLEARLADVTRERDEWEHRAKKGLCPCTPEHSWAEWLNDRNETIDAAQATIERLNAEIAEARELVKALPEQIIAEISAIKAGDKTDEVVLRVADILDGLNKARAVLSHNGGGH